MLEEYSVGEIKRGRNGFVSKPCGRVETAITLLFVFAVSCLAESQDTGSSTSGSSRVIVQDINEYVMSFSIYFFGKKLFFLVRINFELSYIFIHEQRLTSNRGFASTDGSPAKTT